jgi:bidirectional [NiFe] hydrogenase diaphorase subunit
MGGFTALSKVLAEMTPEQVVEEIKKSGLRGRGGGGFPTGLKWDLVRKATGEKKYIVANGDEGDPGAYMDRTTMESDPFLVLEGMAIAAYAVGADQAYFYVRAEYPLAAERLTKAIKKAEKAELLGNRIFGSNFNFRIDIRLGPGRSSAARRPGFSPRSWAAGVSRTLARRSRQTAGFGGLPR